MFRRNFVCLAIRRGYSETPEMSVKVASKWLRVGVCVHFSKMSSIMNLLPLPPPSPPLSPIRCLVLVLPSHLLMADNTLSPPGKQPGSLLLPHKAEGIIRTTHLLSPPVTQLVYIHVKIHAVRVI